MPNRGVFVAFCKVIMAWRDCSWWSFCC